MAGRLAEVSGQAAASFGCSPLPSPLHRGRGSNGWHLAPSQQQLQIAPPFHFTNPQPFRQFGERLFGGGHGGGVGGVRVDAYLQLDELAEVIDVVERNFNGEAAALRGGDAASFADGDGGLETEVAEDGVARRAGLAAVDLSPRAAAKATFA